MTCLGLFLPRNDLFCHSLNSNYFKMNFTKISFYFQDFFLKIPFLGSLDTRRPENYKKSDYLEIQ